METIEWGDGTSELVDVPHDPAGEAAVSLDKTLDLPDRWLTVMAELDHAVAEALKLVDVVLPPQPNTRPSRCGESGAPRLVPAAKDNTATAADVALEGWCRSRYRDGRRLHPSETDRRGNRYYRDLCRWCGGFKARHKTDPPLELHHRYGRVTAARVAATLRALPEPQASKKKQKRG